jgi:hypothetical protein
MESSKSHIPSLLLSLLFVVAAILFLSVALVMGVAAFSSVLTGETIQPQQTILLVVSIFEALILFVAAFISVQRFRQKPFAEQSTSFSPTAWQVAISLVLGAAVIFIGYKIGENGSLNWMLLPMLTLPAVALPIFLVLGLATRGISLGERWRSWSIFGIAMTLVPFFLIFLEIIALIVVLIFAGVYLLTQPDFVFEMQQLSRQIYILGPESEAVQDLLIPYISKPAVLAVALFYFALLVPMMEELLKPLGVWLFARRIDSPAQGFALGALSGAAYALIETFGVSVQTIDWASLLLSRIGTGMLHVTSSALMGAAIVYAIRQRRYLLLLGTYIVSVTLHGFWNTLALLYGFSTVTETLGEETFFNEIQTPLMIGLAVLAAIFLVILVLSNRRLRLILPAPLPEETIR